jgi:hypothetical protein
MAEPALLAAFPSQVLASCKRPLRGAWQGVPCLPCLHLRVSTLLVVFNYTPGGLYLYM